MAKLITQDLKFLAESEDFIDAKVALNRKFKELLESVEKELSKIELEGTVITVTLKGQIYQSNFPFQVVDYDINPKSLPVNIQSKIQDVIGKVVSAHLPKTELPPN